MGLRKIYIPAVYGITHTKQLCIRKPVKYEYICNKQGKVEKKSSTEAKMYKCLLGSFKLNHTL